MYPTSTIEMPAGMVGGILQQVSGIITNFGPLIALITGVLLAAVVVEIIISAIRPK